MIYIRKFICWIVGHNYFYVYLGNHPAEYPNTISVTWGYKICSRCEKQESYQIQG